MEIDNIKSNKYTFQGDTGKVVRKMFNHLEKDIPPEAIQEYGLVKPADVFQKLQDFVSKTDSDIIFDYKKSSILGRLSGFFFKNKQNGKVLPATSRAVIYTRTPIKEEGRLFLVPPEIHPEDRFVLKQVYSKTLDDKIKRSEQKAIDLYMMEGDFISFRMPIVFLPSMLMRGLRTLCKPFMIKIQKQKYEFWNLKSLNAYIEQLTSKYTPNEINKLLQ